MANIGQPNLFIKLLANKYIILLAWILIAVFYTFNYIGYGSINNYLIFKYTYFNASMGYIPLADLQCGVPLYRHQAAAAE
jgi:hypothetical protein